VAKNMKKNVVGPFKNRPCGGSNLIRSISNFAEVVF